MYDCPAQMEVVTLPLVVDGVTVTVTGPALPVQPLELVTVTEYEPAEVTLIVGVFAPVDQL